MINAGIFHGHSVMLPWLTCLYSGGDGDGERERDLQLQLAVNPPGGTLLGSRVRDSRHTSHQVC